MFVLYSNLAQVSAAVPSEAPSTLGVVVVGFLFVMIVLAVLATVTTIIGKIFVKQAAAEASKAAASAEKAAAAASAPSGAAASSGDQEDPALLAVVAAAVHTVIGDRPHRVVSVRSAGPGWAQEGRRQIFSSHRVR